MIVLDTNVVSELMKPELNPAVQFWLDQQSAKELYLASTSLAELRLGMEMMPVGGRRLSMERTLEEILRRFIGDRVLAFDTSAAVAYALLVSKARRMGRAIDVSDGQIAAIAKVHGFNVATRDISPFETAGVPFVNPWICS
jgi:predicted nucleic acid-binding protein